MLLSLGGASGRRVGLTVRADIPPPEHNRELATVLARSLSTDRPDGALVLVVSEAADEELAGERGLPHHDLVWEMCRALPGWPCRSLTSCSSATAGGGPTTAPTTAARRAPARPCPPA